MEKKHLKIEIPEGYEIDKENSTFENIMFKPIKEIIRYNTDYNGVEIKCNGEHFVVVEMNYKFAMDWDEAMRCAKDRYESLPTINQLKIMYNHHDRINGLLKNVKINNNDWYWSSTQCNSDRSWYLNWSNGNVASTNKGNAGYVRFIVNL